MRRRFDQFTELQMVGPLLSPAQFFWLTPLFCALWLAVLVVVCAAFALWAAVLVVAALAGIAYRSVRGLLSLLR